MNLQLATARLGVLLTAEALEAGRHLLLYLFPRKHTPPSPPLQAMHSPLQASTSLSFDERGLGCVFESSICSLAL